MADKTTTLKTKTNDNVYPNIIGDNRDNAISDSAHINHTLTADHKINFRLDTNVSGLIFNSLQKPKGLAKTELVGVGTNGQENIEIGDNLTLANGKLSASGGGALKLEIESGSVTLEAKQYRVGEFVKGNVTSRKVEAFIGIFLFKSGSSNEGLPSVTVGDAVFIPYYYLYDYNKRNLRFGLLCIKSGTVATETYETVYIRYVWRA